MSVRPLSLADLDALVALEQENMLPGWSRAQLAAEFDAAAGLQLGLDHGGQLAGYAFFRSCGPEAELFRIVVCRARRGLGLGHILLKQGLQLLAAAGREVCFLEVRASNRAARKLYRGEGFEECGLRPAYYSCPQEDAVVMAKELAVIKL
ncbi:ribosomal protein S18-alanine N-acetyltransferase [Desulfogranum mediterraneum]|uniref:ribosomal protein S18-alanine N-acetyltransferase n=1 Tax=Desulfogranum mediterraneum TaxID=160661 RepID=UPI0004131E15|nr:ribosomal protein S18-alanine N-acetyltransferase [Desulfogranum mediterraneum]